MSFPTLVYKSPGRHHASKGTYDYRGIFDGIELMHALADDWFRTLPEALAGEHDGSDDSAPTREELEEKATELGVKFDGRTTDKVLAVRIEDALGKGE